MSAALEQTLRAFETKKGTQIAVLIVPTTKPEEIEQYATRVFDTWKIGRKNVDDGVLLLWAKDDRRIRIEVGRGLEGPIPDVLASRIINDTMRPLFRSEAWYEGLDKATDQLIGLIDGEALPAAAATVSEYARPELGSLLSGFLLHTGCRDRHCVVAEATRIFCLTGRSGDYHGHRIRSIGFAASFIAVDRPHLLSGRPDLRL